MEEMRRRELVFCWRTEKLIKDVTFGKTKLFVRSPSTLFELEKARSQLIPGIVIFLQKMCRGTLARKEYQRMLAARMIWGKYRKYKMRTYINTSENIQELQE